jgi:hypothetical protein
VAVLDLRLRRLERARRDHHGVFFLAIGRDDAEIEAAIADACASLALQLNDQRRLADHQRRVEGYDDERVQMTPMASQHLPSC